MVVSRKRGPVRAKRTTRCLTCGAEAKTFGSITEWSYFWDHIRHRLRSGAISALEFHPRFDLPGGIRAEFDFAWTEASSGLQRVVDVKPGGSKTPRLTRAFVRNRKQVQAIYGVEVEVVRWDPPRGRR